jgi:hypothetical protein
VVLVGKSVRGDCGRPLLIEAGARVLTDLGVGYYYCATLCAHSGAMDGRMLLHVIPQSCMNRMIQERRRRFALFLPLPRFISVCSPGISWFGVSRFLD